MTSAEVWQALLLAYCARTLFLGKITSQRSEMEPEDITTSNMGTPGLADPADERRSVRAEHALPRRHVPFVRILIDCFVDNSAAHARWHGHGTGW